MASVYSEQPFRTANLRRETTQICVSGSASGGPETSASQRLAPRITAEDHAQLDAQVRHRATRGPLALLREGELRSSRRDIIILGALALLVLAPGATSGSLADWDEAIYAEVALQYHLTGDWLHPSWNGAPWYHKPPLAMWLTAAAYALAGVGEGTARLFSVLCGIGGVLATYGIARSTLGRPVALISALILLSTPHYFLFGKLAMLDAPLTCFLTLGFLAYWRAQSDPRWLLAAGAAFATALMIKGAAAVIGPLAVTLHASLHRPSQLIGSRWLWLGLAVGLGIALPWHLYQHIEVGAAFWDQYFFYHTLLRTREAIEGHTGGPAYYLEVLVRRQRPWFLLALPAVLYCVFVARRERSKQLSLFLCWITAVVGAVMTVQTRNGIMFDAIVFAEKQSGHWLAGSNNFKRTQSFNGSNEKETQPVHVAIVYKTDGTIIGYRNGKPYGRPYKTGLQSFAAGSSEVIFGLRHGTGAGPSRMLSGKVLKARLYDRALNPAEVLASAGGNPNYISEKEMLAAMTEAQRKLLVELSVSLRKLTTELSVLEKPGAGAPDPWRDLAQAMFNLKEFIYVQ